MTEEFNVEVANSISKINDMVSPSIESRFTRMKNYIDTVVDSKNVHSLILFGKSGIGKSTYAIYFLAKRGLQYGKDYIVMNTYSSPLSLYCTLYENNDKIILIDDMPELFRDKVGMNIFLSALWSPSGVRQVSWNSILTMEKLDMPKQFNFNGKIIAMMNKIPRNIESIVSRCITYEQKFKRKELMTLMKDICEHNNIDMEVYDFIHNNATLATDISLRTLIKIAEIKKINANWKDMALEQMEVNEPMKLVLDLTNGKLPTEQQIAEFMRESGMSRRTYFVYKKELKARE